MGGGDGRRGVGGEEWEEEVGGENGRRGWEERMGGGEGSAKRGVGGGNGRRGEEGIGGEEWEGLLCVYTTHLLEESLHRTCVECGP